MDALRPRLVQLTVQLRDALSRRDTMRRLREHGGSSSRRSCLPWLMVTTSAKPVALGGVTEMTTSEVRLIAERIEARLASIAEHEAAIRSDLEALASLTSPAGESPGASPLASPTAGPRSRYTLRHDSHRRNYPLARSGLAGRL